MAKIPALPDQSHGAEPHVQDGLQALVVADLSDVLFRPLWPHVVSLAVALLMAAILWVEVGARAILPWAALGLLGYATRIAVIVSYRRARDPVAAAPRWVRRYCWTAILLGLFWGGAPLVIAMSPSSPNDGSAALVLFIVAAMMAGGVMLHAAQVGAVDSFIWPAAILVMLACLSWREWPYHTIASLALVYAAMLKLLSLRLNSTAIDALRGQHETKALADELTKAHAETKQASRAKSEFLANMSHELRTPLNAIIGFSEIMAREILGPIGQARYREYASDIQESGKHLLGVINDILDLSRVEAGKMILVEEEVDLASVIGGCVHLLSHRAAAAGIVLETAFGIEPCRIRADEGRLRQIAFNLIANAIKFTPPGGDVRVGIEFGSDGDMAFVVADNGVGMRPEDIPVALIPFQQVQSAGTRNHGGTGLGLPLTKTLVELHGGRLEIASALGQGTTVTAFFPRERVLSSRNAKEDRPPKPDSATT